MLTLTMRLVNISECSICPHRVNLALYNFSVFVLLIPLGDSRYLNRSLSVQKQFKKRKIERNYMIKKHDLTGSFDKTSTINSS